MKIIDFHHHLIEENNYIDNLLRTMDSLEIEKCALIGMGNIFSGLFVKGERGEFIADDNEVAKAVKQHTDRFFGLGFIRLGKDSEEKVKYFYESGFLGLKFHIPLKPYSSEEFFPIYELAQKYKMPCLFHTGILKLPSPSPEEKISSFNMMCIHLEYVAQQFPDLKIIIAHLGVQDYLTALTLIRLFDNIYADLSGTTPGWRANIPMEDWKRLLWFPNAHKKILFGSDVHFSEVKENIGIYTKIMNAAGWDTEKKQCVFMKNAASLLSLK